MDMIQPNHDYHVVEMYRVPAEVLDWLYERHGPGDGSTWWYIYPKIYFANPRDHTMFILRWS
jgi:hypothetical protein